MKTLLKCVGPFFACLSLIVVPALGAGGIVLQGRVSDPKGNGVVGAELRLIDASGKIQLKALSNANGLYRFPPLPETTGYQIKISHIRFKPVEDKDALGGSSIVAPQINHLKPGESVALLLSSKTVSRNFLLTPSLGTPQMPAVEPIDPNLAEYYYQRALLLLGENKKREAITYLTLYAQTGKNPRQVNRALDLIVENR